MSPAREHFDKYEAIAQALGIATLKRLILNSGITEEEIKNAIAANDEHLNSIRLTRWDHATGWKIHFIMNRYYPSHPWKQHKDTNSLGSRVCILKHVARHHIAGQPSPE